MPENTSNKLIESVLARLENITNEVVQSQGYTEDTEKLKLLVELTREQVNSNENTDT
jgi:hypothetical protein